MKNNIRTYHDREKGVEKIEGHQDKMDQIRQERPTRVDPQTQSDRSPSILHDVPMQHNNFFNDKEATTNQIKSPVTQATFTPPSKLDKVEDSQAQKLTTSKPLTEQTYSSRTYQRQVLKKSCCHTSITEG